MFDLTPSVVIPLVVGVLAGVMILYAVGVYFARELAVHDLRVEAHRLKLEYERRMRVLNGTESNVEVVEEGDEEGVIEAEVVGTAPPPAAPARKAA